MTDSQRRMDGPEYLLATTKTSILEEDWDTANAQAAAILVEHPDCPEAVFLQAVIAIGEQDLASCVERAQQAMDMGLNVRECADLLGIAYGLAGDMDTALYFAKLSTALPSSEPLSKLMPASVPGFAQILELVTEKPLLHRAVQALVAKQWAKAEWWLRQHLTFQPTSREGHLALGTCLIAQGTPRAAVESLRAARHQLPHDADIASLLAKALGKIGQHDAASACHRWAQACAPDNPGIHASSLLESIQEGRNEAEGLAAGFRAWGERFGLSDTGDGHRVFVNDNDRSLTVGYLVAGRGVGPQGTVLAEILGKRDRQRFRVIGFGHGLLTDGANVKFQKCVDAWRDVAEVDASTFQAMVTAEGVDILVDLAGFTTPDLLTAFGARMAPCQVAWLGAPHGTGLANMDFLLTDTFVDPEPANTERYVETLAYLDLGCALVAPSVVDEAMPERSVADGLVLAADATLAELDWATVEAWAEIMHQLPGSVLLLRNYDFEAPDNLAMIVGMFGNFGLANRIDVVKEDDGSTFFAHGDIGLLPLACPRPQSVVDALSSGIPVVCPVGQGRHGRMAASVLSQLGYGERMIAGTLEAYVEKAVDWATNAEERSRLRGALPTHLRQAPSFEPERRMRDLEAAYETMWRTVQARNSDDTDVRKSGIA